MAVIILGKSKCKICGKIIESGQRIVTFSAFVPNEADPLHYFHDEAFHESCFYSHPLSKKALVRQADYDRFTQSRTMECNVCGNEIERPDKYLILGHLTDDPENPLFRFNYYQSHRSCLPKWAELHQVITYLEQGQMNGTLRGRWLDLLLAELKSV